jgi:hypothetical protein
MIENSPIRVFFAVITPASAGLRMSFSLCSAQSPIRSRLSKTSSAYRCSIGAVAESCLPQTRGVAAVCGRDEDTWGRAIAAVSGAYREHSGEFAIGAFHAPAETAEPESVPESVMQKRAKLQCSQRRSNRTLF